MKWELEANKVTKGYLQYPLFQLRNKNTLNVPPDKELPGNTMKLPYVLIGDEAYPLKTSYETFS